MNKNVYVCSHSPSLSMLLFETSSSKNDQIGLLLGTIQKETVITATDDNDAANEEQTALYIEHVLPLPDYLFDRYGESSREAIESWCQPLTNCQIIGWFSFRWNQRLRCSLRDHLIHKWLLNYQQNEPFILAVLSGTTRHDQATHCFRQLFLRRNIMNVFESVPFKVCSLSNPPVNKDGYLLSFDSPQAINFKKLINSSGLNPSLNLVDRMLMLNFHLAACCELSTLGKRLVKIEAKRFEAQKELEKLKDNIRPEIKVEPPHAATGHDNQPPPFHRVVFDPTRDYAACTSDNQPYFEQKESDEVLGCRPTSSQLDDSDCWHDALERPHMRDNPQHEINTSPNSTVEQKSFNSLRMEENQQVECNVSSSVAGSSPLPSTERPYVPGTGRGGRGRGIRSPVGPAISQQMPYDSHFTKESDVPVSTALNQSGSYAQIASKKEFADGSVRLASNYASSPPPHSPGNNFRPREDQKYADGSKTQASNKTRKKMEN